MFLFPKYLFSQGKALIKKKKKISIKHWNCNLKEHTTIEKKSFNYFFFVKDSAKGTCITILLSTNVAGWFLKNILNAG